MILKIIFFLLLGIVLKRFLWDKSSFLKNLDISKVNHFVLTALIFSLGLSFGKSDAIGKSLEVVANSAVFAVSAIIFSVILVIFVEFLSKSRVSK